MLLLLMKMALILMLALIVFVPYAHSQVSANADKIPIAGLFDLSHDEEIRAAFSYAIANENTRLKTLKLNALLNKLDMKNSYSFGNRICQLMANGIFAFFATHTMDTIDAIKSYSSTFRMPFITSNIAMNTTGQKFGYELYLRPYYAKAIADIVKHHRWNDLIYLYNSDEGLERLQTLLDFLSMDKYLVRMRLFRVRDVDDAYRTLQRLDSRNREEKRIILDLPTENCEDLLQRQIKGTPGMMHHYLLVRLEIKDINFVRIVGPFIDGGLKVTGLRLVDRNTKIMRGFLSGWSKLDSDLYKGAGNKISSEAALAVDAVGVISRAMERVISEKPNVFKQTLRNGKVYNNGSQGIDCDAEPLRAFVHGQDIMKAMREVEFIGLTGVIKFDQFGLRRDYELDVFESTLYRGLAQIGSWHSETGLKIRHIDIIRPSKGNNLFRN